MARFRTHIFEQLLPKERIRLGCATTGTAKEVIKQTLRRAPSMKFQIVKIDGKIHLERTL
jgi:hypothetical protein